MDSQIFLDGQPQPTNQDYVILAVDDNDDSLWLIQKALEPYPYIVLDAQDGQTALTLAEAHLPDLVLLDIVLPDMTGFEVIQQLRLNPATATTPIIAVTALARIEDQIRILQAGCSDYIAKPYMLDVLEETIKQHFLAYITDRQSKLGV